MQQRCPSFGAYLALTLVTFGISTLEANQQRLNWSDPSKMTPAQQLTIIEGPAWGKREQTLKRFEFLLGKFNNLCREPRKAQPHDMLASVHRQLAEAGLDEGLLQLSNTLHRMTTDIATNTRSKPGCAEIWSMYLMLRRDKGDPPEEVRKAVTAIATVFGSVGN